jgi:hypothetical protein
MNQLVRLASPAVRALLTAAGERASMRFLEPGAAASACRPLRGKDRGRDA